MLAGEDYQEINAKYRLAVSLALSYCHGSPDDKKAGSERYDATVHDRDRSGHLTKKHQTVGFLFND